MKKFLFVLALGAFVACNDSSKADETATDTVPAVLPVDPAVVTMDSTTVVIDSSAAKMVDTLKK
ncbi:MAG: hypothetical protein ABI687_02705 [Flavitalea sp.]